MTSIRCRPSFVLALVAVTLAIGGCGGQDAGALIASAKDYLAKHDTKAAIIQLRNARQQAPDNAEVRFLLGRALLESGDPAGAEAELRRSAELKHPAEQVLPLIAHALVAQGEFRKLNSEFADPAISDPKARADIQTSVAIGALAQGDIAQARSLLQAALEANPNFARAHLVRAQLAVRGGDVAQAHAALDAALASAPNDPEAATLKAELMAIEGRRDDALRLLEQTAAANPHAMQVRFSLVSMLATSGQIDKAATVAESMNKDAPSDFRSLYANALVLVRKGEAAKARELTQKLMATRPDHLPTLYLSALADYQLKNYALAEDALQKVLARAPNDVPTRRLLAGVYLRTGRATQALEVAQTGLRRTPDDPALLRVVAEARLLTGNVAEATRLYERASALDRDPNPAAKLRLAQIRLATGDASRGLAELEQLAAEDSTKIQADLALYSAHLRKREYAKALAAVDAIEKKQPRAALNSELRGNVHLMRRDLKEARTHFAKALESEPNRLSSARSLALIDLQEGKVADARARYERIAKAEPRNELPLIALAEILALSGAPASEVKSALDRAVAANPNAAAPRVAIVAHHRRLNDNKGALEAARVAATALPNEARLIELYGQVQMLNHDYANARDTFTRLAQVVPHSPAPWLRVSETYLATKDFAAAVDAQRKALSVQPDYAPALVALATTQLVAGRPEEAIAEARKMQRERPKEAIGFALEAELLAAQKKFPEAIAAMREAVARNPAPTLASRQYALLVAAGRGGEANAFADRWFKDHPKDAAFLTQIGQHRQAAKDVAGATTSYRAALEIEPENVVVLNNLAWLLNEQGKAEARELAERAYRLAPLNPNIIDTLAAVEMRQGDRARAISLMRQATNLSPQDAQLRINLARALVKSGDKAGARRELEQVGNLNARPPLKAEAEQLLREL